MHYTYVLRSKKDGKWYTGASGDLRRRLTQHNANEVRATKNRGPFEVIYYEACHAETDAFAREKYLKSGPGKQYLGNRLKRFLSLTGRDTERARPVRARSLKETQSSNRGFVALMTVIIIGAILMILVFTLGVSSFFSRFSVLDTENKRASLELAEGCVNAAMLKIAQNPAYAPAATGECISAGGTCGASGPQRTCKICTVSYSGSTATIITRASYNHAYTNIYSKVDTTPGAMAITYWSEKASSGVSTCTVP